MRLLAPLNGIKTSQGHFITHFVFFVAMFFVDTDIDNTVEILSSDPEGDIEAAHRLRYLGGAATTEVEIDKSEYKLEELYVFEYLMYGHLATALFQVTMIAMKKYNYFNSSQII